MSLKDYLMQNQASMKEWLTTRDRIIAQKIFEAYCIPVDDLLKCFEEQESTENLKDQQESFDERNKTESDSDAGSEPSQAE